MPEYSIRFATSASRQIKKLTPIIRRQLDKALVRLAQNPRQHGCEKLEGEILAYRFRMGDY